jgi:hypothetical protein
MAKLAVGWRARHFLRVERIQHARRRNPKSMRASLPQVPRPLPALCGAILLMASFLVGAAATDARRKRVVIEGLTQPAAELRISDFAGKDLTAELKPEGGAGRVAVTLGEARQFVVKPKEIATLVAARSEKMVLPGGVVVPLMQGEAGAEAKSAWFRLTFEASPLPAAWDAQLTGYITRLTFGLRRPPNLPESVAPAAPVIVKLGFEGMTADEVPPLTIEAPGLENEKTVELRFQPRTANPRVLVRSTISDVNLELKALARLDVRPMQREMLGFGLETVDVVVTNVLAHGEPQAVEGLVPLVIETSGRARAEPANAAFGAGEAIARFRLRSAGIGPVTIVTSGNGLMGSAEIQQRFPTGPLLATLIGAALGGFARRFVKGARKKQAARRVIEGTVVGVVAFVAAVLGVGYLELPPAIVATEAGAFLVGALAGFAGVTVFERLAKRNAPAE